MYNVKNNLEVGNAHIIFRNFAGKETKYNRAGRRNFAVLFDEETGMRLREDGWNCTPMPQNDDYDEIAYKLPVEVSFKSYPPKIYIISGHHKTLIDEDTVASLDYAEIENIDLIIRPYNWEVGDKSGVKAYAQTMYVTIRVDNFASKYDDFDEDNPF